MIMVTHEMRFAREISDRVCFFDKGKIVEEGPPDRLLVRPSHPRTASFLAAVLGQATPILPPEGDVVVRLPGAGGEQAVEDRDAADLKLKAGVLGG
jgi:ABC-type dipeptide/oligopeptide/nickel transport system ATPase component